MASVASLFLLGGIAIAIEDPASYETDRFGMFILASIVGFFPAAIAAAGAWLLLRRGPTAGRVPATRDEPE